MCCVIVIGISRALVAQSQTQSLSCFGWNFESGAIGGISLTWAQGVISRISGFPPFSKALTFKNLIRALIRGGRWFVSGVKRYRCHSRGGTQRVSYREAPPRGSSTHPLNTNFDRDGTPFIYLSLIPFYTSGWPSG